MALGIGFTETATAQSAIPGNGHVDPGLLSSISGEAPGHKLLQPAGSSWVTVRAGVQTRYGWTPSLADAYRDYDRQVATFHSNYSTVNTGLNNSRNWDGVWYWRRSDWNPPTAVPGRSNHGWGATVDVANMQSFNEKYEQFADVAAAHGWSNAEGRSIGEAWHWTYGAPNSSNEAQPEPAPIDSLEDTVKPFFIRRNDGAMVIVGPEGVRALTFEQWGVWQNLGYTTAPGMGAMDPGPFNAVIESLGGMK